MSGFGGGLLVAEGRRLFEERLLRTTGSEVVERHKREFFAKSAFQLSLSELFSGRRRQVCPLATHSAELFIQECGPGGFIKREQVRSDFGPAVFMVPVFQLNT